MNDKILFLDIDDTLLIGDNIFAYIKKNGIKRKITTLEYSKLTLKDLKCNIDFKEFDDPIKIKNSILNGKPLLKNLKIIDNYIKNGWELGILTARGAEDTIKEVIIDWLGKNLINKFKLNKKNIYAVGDKDKKYKGKNSSIRKVNILKLYMKIYNRVCLIDDSKKTINYIKEINKLEKLKIEYIHVKN